MSSTPQKQELTRNETIDLLRTELLGLMTDESSICRAVAERGVFCRGFLRFSDSELRKRFAWIERKLDHPDRQGLEDVVDRWLMARQEVTQLPLACDIERIEHDACRGWDDFSDEELSRFLLELSQKTPKPANPK